MKGNVYTRQKCWVCGGKLIHDENNGGCFCKEHPQVRADKDFVVKFGRAVQRRFQVYEAAIRWLTGLRYETDKGTFDERDYSAGQPMGFCNLAMGYLKWKKRQNLASYHHIERYVMTACKTFGNMNVKAIRRKELEEHLYSIPGISEKTRHNHKSTLHDFWWKFLYEYEEILRIDQLPKFPDIPYELGFRKVATIENREKVMDRVYRDNYVRNPKLWLFLDMACSYSKLRPIDLRQVKEGDIDIHHGILTVERPSKSKRRSKPYVIRIRLVDYHVEEIKRLKIEHPALPDTLFFRHPKGIKGVEPGTPISAGRYYKVWKKACAKVGIDDLDMYAGTRHTTVTAIGQEYGRKEARKHSGHATNAAFDRYCQGDDETDLEMSERVARIRGKVIPMRKKETG